MDSTTVSRGVSCRSESSVIKRRSMFRMSPDHSMSVVDTKTANHWVISDCDRDITDGVANVILQVMVMITTTITTTSMRMNMNMNRNTNEYLYDN
jgi:hypothetical protein